MYNLRNFPEFATKRKITLKTGPETIDRRNYRQFCLKSYDRLTHSFE